MLRVVNPMFKIFKNSIASFVFVMLAVPDMSAQSPTPGRTVLDGVYSEGQATRGQASYMSACSVCHGDALEGISAPALIDDRLIERWREGMLDTFYDYLRGRMPPSVGRGGPKLLPDSAYIDIVAYILKMNAYPSGPSELTSDLAANVLLVGKTGPKPVPDNALVITVGCLQSSDGRWILSSATEPVRTRTADTPNPAELRASSQKELGTHTFRLADLEAVADLAPEAHVGHKMQAKGYLVWQPNAARIALVSMDMLDSACK